MSAQHTPAPCPMTPTRLAWLKHLAQQQHETPWSKMPKRETWGRRASCGAVTNATWRPMVAAGWIEARYGQRHFSEPNDNLFKITEAGRAAIAKATGAA